MPLELLAGVRLFTFEASIMIMTLSVHKVRSARADEASGRSKLRVFRTLVWRITKTFAKSTSGLRINLEVVERDAGQVSSGDAKLTEVEVLSTIEKSSVSQNMTELRNATPEFKENYWGL